MNIAQLNIYQQQGLISIKQEFGSVTIERPQPKVHMHSDPLLLEINKAEGGLVIDQTKAWAAYGTMNPVEWSNKIAKQSQQIAYQAIAKYVQDGNRLAAIHKPGDALVELAKQATHSNLIPINYTGPAGYDHVRYHYVPDELSFSIQEGKVHYQVETYDPIIERIPAQVEIGVKQYPSIRFEVTGNHVDRTL